MFPRMKFHAVFTGKYPYPESIYWAQKRSPSPIILSCWHPLKSDENDNFPITNFFAGTSQPHAGLFFPFAPAAPTLRKPNLRNIRATAAPPTGKWGPGTVLTCSQTAEPHGALPFPSLCRPFSRPSHRPIPPPTSQPDTLNLALSNATNPITAIPPQPLPAWRQTCTLFIFTLFPAPHRGPFQPRCNPTRHMGSEPRMSPAPWYHAVHATRGGRGYGKHFRTPRDAAMQRHASPHRATMLSSCHTAPNMPVIRLDVTLAVAIRLTHSLVTQGAAWRMRCTFLRHIATPQAVSNAAVACANPSFSVATPTDRSTLAILHQIKRPLHWEIALALGFHLMCHSKHESSSVVLLDGPNHDMWRNWPVCRPGWPCSNRRIELKLHANDRPWSNWSSFQVAWILAGWKLRFDGENHGKKTKKMAD